MADKILVTGASGFIATHCILDLLAHGYEVRGSIRDMSRAEALQNLLTAHEPAAKDMEFVEAHLDESECWRAAVAGCSGVFHVASPVPTIQPKDPAEVVEPAVAGTLNVLSAAKAAGIKRVVLTSSVAAVTGSKMEDRQYTADDWSDPDDPLLTPYSLSKTMAEKAAWDFVKNDGPELATINPALVLGPALEVDYGSSLEALYKLLRREVPLLPRFGFEIVDVRDVASLHRLTFEAPEANGQRFIAANGFLWFRQIAEIINAEFPDHQVPQREMPNWLTYLASFVVKEIGSFLHDLDTVKNMDHSPAEVIGWKPRSPEEAVIAGARSLIELEVV